MVQPSARRPDAVIQTEGLYGWGAAPFGFNPDPRYTVAEVGPGFNNTQFGGGPNASTRPARAAPTTRTSLQQALASGRQILAIETWNELGEGTGILETAEFGRQYIDILRGYADRLKGRG